MQRLASGYQLWPSSGALHNITHLAAGAARIDTIAAFYSERGHSHEQLFFAACSHLSWRQIGLTTLHEQGREGAEDEATKAAKTLDPKAIIRLAARDAICNAAVDFETRVHGQLDSILQTLSASAADDGRDGGPPDATSEEACWRHFAKCRAAEDLQTWQQKAYFTLPLE